jgi:PAS domain S-box-containing protein
MADRRRRARASSPQPRSAPSEAALAFLARLANEFTAVLHLQELVDRVLESLREALGFDSCTIALLDDASPDVLAMVGAAGIRASFRGLTIPRGHGVTWAVMEAGTPLYVPDMDADPHIYRRDPKVKSGIYAPLTLRGRSIGVLSAHRGQVDAFTPQDLDLLTVVARYLAGAFEVARLHEEAERLAAVLESSGDAIIGTALDGTIRTWNAGAARIYGFPAAEAIGRPVTIIVPPDSLAEYARNRQRVQRGEHIDHFETVRVRKDGTRIDIALSVSPIRDAAGRVTGILGIGRDITERKRAEDALRKSEERYRTLFDGVPIGLCRVAPGGEILEANAAFVKMLRYPDRETLLGTNARGLSLDPEERARWTERLLREGEVANVEGQLRAYDGSVVGVRASGRAVFGASGRVSHFEEAVEDVTLSRQVEEEARRAREAERASQAKSEFLSRMSHELRTPLNAILGFAQLMEMDAAQLAPEHRESLQHILKGGRHLLDLINEVLDIARIETGRMGISLEPVSLQEVTREALDLINPMALRAGVRLRTDPAAPSERYVLADRQRIKQVLLNLLSNAVKYNQPGGTVTLSSGEAPDGRVRISVGDTGHGISPEKMAQLFVPFERLGAEQTGVEGTGLGLALSKRLVEAMGGALGVRSVVGQGSTFWVDLAPATDPGEQARQTAPRAELAAFPRTRVLLYVEDNLSNLELIKRLLAPHPDVRLIPAMQGRLGLELARQHRPDLILLDVQLPDIDGGEVLWRLRADPETREIPIVVLSADATPAQVDRMRAAGARAYLTKPFDIKRLVELLNEILQGAASPRTGA